MSLNYVSSNTNRIQFSKGNVYYLSVMISDAVYQGSVWVSDLSQLCEDLRDEFNSIANLEFRGVGVNMVRGNHNSLTLGIGASVYSSTENLTQTQAVLLRTQVRNAVLNVSGLSFSEIRVDTAFVQSSTY